MVPDALGNIVIRLENHWNRVSSLGTSWNLEPLAVSTRPKFVDPWIEGSKLCKLCIGTSRQHVYQWNEKNRVTL
jgi:hypothetical protein